MIIISFLIGGMAGGLGMALFSGQAYEKGWKSGYKQAMAESIKIVEETVQGK